ncbi:MAG: hypothetical protein QOJ38_833 [Solirubrobacterales bacterium]|nr:hypothetical protein [Solirubrobacterales bacterium]
MTNQVNERQLSVFEQLRDSEPSLADTEIVRRLCEQLLDEADVRPPVPVEMLASLRGIAKVQSDDQPYAGMLSPEDGRLVVTVRRGDGHRRRRFTVCHEAAHTLFPGFSERRQYRCNGERTWTEKMCDLAAAELLLPRRFFEADLRQAGFGLEAVEELARDYQASIEATARRSVALWSAQEAMLIVLRARHKPSEAGREDELPPKLRVEYSFGRGDWPFVLRHKSASASGLGRALEGEILDEISEIDELCVGSAGRVRVQARRYGADGRVIALINKTTDNAGGEG